MSWSRLPFTTQLAVRQLRYMGWRLLGTFSGVFVAILLVFMQNGSLNALVGSVLNLPRALNADIVLAGREFETLMYTPPWLPRALLNEAGGMQGVAAASPLYANIGQIRNPLSGTSMTARFVAFNLAQPALDLPEVQGALPLLALPRAALLDARSRRYFEPIIGKVEREGEERLYFQIASLSQAPELRALGLYRLGPDFTIDGGFLMSDLNFYRYFGTELSRVSLGLLRAEPGEDVPALRDRLAAWFGDRAQVFTKAQLLASERRYLLFQTPMGMVLGFGLLIGIFIGSVFVLQVLHGIIEANLSEYAVLRAMGYPDRFFVSLVLQISAVIGIGAFLPALGATLVLYRLAAGATGMTYAFTWLDLALVLAATLFMCAAAGLFAIRKLRRSNPLALFA